MPALGWETGDLAWQPWSGEGVLRPQEGFPCPNHQETCKLSLGEHPTSPVYRERSFQRPVDCLALSVPSDSDGYVCGGRVVPGVPNPASLVILGSMAWGVDLSFFLIALSNASPSAHQSAVKCTLFPNPWEESLFLRFRVTGQVNLLVAWAHLPLGMRIMNVSSRHKSRKNGRMEEGGD